MAGPTISSNRAGAHMATGNRSIFEDVARGANAPAPRTGGIDRGPGGARGLVRGWLVVLFLLVTAMIMVGGLTRLTDSGLSITEWRPVTGALPPLNDADWAREFAKYKESPEYQIEKGGMALAEFKTIYWWEWGHRQLGRLIGLVWAVGFIFLWATRRIPKGWTNRLLGVGALGGLQGAVGWWMVSSGLTGEALDVASYRLAVHLGIAFAILGILTWYVLLLGRAETDLMQARRVAEGRQFSMATGLMHLVFLQILLGALVAGIDAGRGFPTWPLMNGSFFPADAFYVPGRPIWAAFFENAGLVQFMHRMSAYLLFAYGIFVWLKGRQSPYRSTRIAFHAVMAMLVVQMVLGIAAALTAAQVHVAITHQIGAILLWVLILQARHLSRYPVQGSIRMGTA